MDNFVYIPIKSNSKESAFKWGHLKTTDKRISKFENCAIVTGSVSGVVVVDIDNVNVWNEYLKDHELPNTLYAKSPNGLHFYFKYTEKLNRNYVNLRKGEGKKAKGIDIRSNDGYILCEPSKIDGKAYKFVNKQTSNIDIPDELLMFLFLGQSQKVLKKDKEVEEESEEESEEETPNMYTKSKEIYYIDDSDLEHLLESLPKILRRQT